MKKFVILTDTSCNLDKNWREKFDIEVVPMHFYLNEQEHDSSCDWEEISAKEYYDAIRNGARVHSAQVNSAQYQAAFRKYIEQGCDVLSVSCTEGLSSSVNESRNAQKEVSEQYPDAKIICIDSANACFSLGMLVMEASRLRSEGKTIEEVAQWIEEHKHNFNEVGTVDKLTYLKRAGRISASSAFFGGILGIKPIIVFDEVGHNVAIEKVKGRRKSFERIAEMVAQYVDLDAYNKIFIAHGDCLEEVQELQSVIESKLPGKAEFYLADIEPTIGSATGPGNIIVDFYGDKAVRDLAKKQ